LFPVGAVEKLCFASSNSFLKELQIAFVVIAILMSPYKVIMVMVIRL
jgi:hypothetical protein